MRMEQRARFPITELWSTLDEYAARAFVRVDLDSRTIEKPYRVVLRNGDDVVRVSIAGLGA